jgi:N utilization substance protein B
MASRRKGRVLAFQALYCWEAAHVPVEELVNFSWLKKSVAEANSDEPVAESEARTLLIDEKTAAFSQLLITGTIENIKAVDDLIKKHLENWDITRLGRVDLAIMRISVYTLMFQPETSPSIVIDEAIGISKEFGTDDSFRFINGVLDSIRKTLQAEKKCLSQSQAV